VSVELVHLGSLYHDDVMDEAPTRRTVDSVNFRWGNLKAILAGDFLLAKASEIAASLGTEVAGLLASTIGGCARARCESCRHAYNIGRTEKNYYSRRSPARPPRCSPPRVASVASSPTCPDRSIDTLTTFGHSYGMAFQVVDDVLDLVATDEQLGKPAGHDMEEGVYTLPVLRTLANGRSSGDELRDLLGKPLEPEERDKALAIVRGDEGIESAIATARQYVATALAACEGLGDGPVVDALREAPGFLLASSL
jgi:heptaprenyl diphosphate synthase